MADFNSSLPVRTQNNGDVVIEIADGTTPSQKMAVNAAGSAQVAGQGVAGTPAGGVVSVQGVAGGTAIPISGTVTASNPSVSTVGAAPPASATFIGGQASTSAPTYITGDLEPLSLNLAGALRTDGSGVTQPVSGTVAVSSISGTVAVTQSTSPWVTKDQSDGPVAPGAVASFSQLSGGQFNTVLPTLTNTQQSAIQLDASGRLIISPSTSSSIVTVSNLPATVDTNYGTVGASTLRAASQMGNATGAADFNAGTTGAQTLRVVANQGTANATPWNQNISQIAGAAPSASNSLPVEITLGTSFISASNPLPVTIDPLAAGTPKNFYTDSAAVAIGATATQSTTAAGTTGFYLQSILVSGSGKFKAVVSIGGTPFFAAFNSTATPSVVIPVPNNTLIATGTVISVAMTNLDLAAQDLYSTLSGFQI